MMVFNTFNNFIYTVVVATPYVILTKTNTSGNTSFKLQINPYPSSVSRADIAFDPSNGNIIIAGLSINYDTYIVYLDQNGNSLT